MSWIEAQIDNITCPHCGEETSEHVEFNILEADVSGVRAKNCFGRCDKIECDKNFYFTARIDFDVYASTTHKELK